MNITLELTPEMARKITEMATSGAATEEQMRPILSELAAQIPSAAPNAQKLPRQAGIMPGFVTAHHDFDDPLPDDFWLGDEATDPIYATMQKS